MFRRTTLTSSGASSSVAGRRRWPLYVPLAVAVLDLLGFAASASIQGASTHALTLKTLRMHALDGLILTIPACAVMLALVLGIVRQQLKLLFSLAAGAGVFVAAYGAARCAYEFERANGDHGFVLFEPLTGVLFSAVFGVVAVAIAHFVTLPILLAARDAIWQRDEAAGDRLFLGIALWRTPFLLVAYLLLNRGLSVLPLTLPLAVAALSAFGGWHRGAVRRERLQRILRDEDAELVARECVAASEHGTWWIRAREGKVFVLIARPNPATYRETEAIVPVAYASCVLNDDEWRPATPPGLLSAFDR